MTRALPTQLDIFSRDHRALAKQNRAAARRALADRTLSLTARTALRDHHLAEARRLEALDRLTTQPTGANEP